MKKLFSAVFFAAVLFTGLQATAQEKMKDKAPEDKTKRPSPPAKVSEKINSGATISIDYSQPSVKGRAIGKDLEPMDGQVWRTGANEATVFETDKDITVNGAKLPAGKYAFFTIFNGEDVTLIFNKTAAQWGAFKYKEADDQLRVNAKASAEASSMEKMTFTISDAGMVSLWWGNKKVDFMVM
ncbi:MAG: DUF2911 domain-containing protein [Ferruginibacter sp.]